MAAKKIVILDGGAPGDGDLAPVLGALTEVFQTEGDRVETFVLRERKLAHCIGCFGCWIKTPGVCVEADDGREIAGAVIRADVAVLFTPVTFGGYSPELKKMVDRFVQLASPFFAMDHGEVHHPPRYAHRPRFIVIGVQRQPNPAEAAIFRTLAGRNAINMHPQSYAAEVVLASEDAAALRARFASLLTRCDELPYGKLAAALMPGPAVETAIPEPPGERRALLLVGSPKTSEPSTSGALGGFLVDRLAQRGWQTESLTLRASVQRPEGENELLAAVDRAGLVVLAFPLYVDALPYLMTRALALIAAHRHVTPSPAPQRLVAIVNSGFPEQLQNSLALAICREFAAQSGFAWAGGLAFGGGGMIGGQPLAKEQRTGPPIPFVIQGLEMTAAALAEGRPVPAAAPETIARKRLPAAIWNRLYMWLAGLSFQKLAARNGLRKDRLMAQPYAS